MDWGHNGKVMDEEVHNLNNDGRNLNENTNIDGKGWRESPKKYNYETDAN